MDEGVRRAADSGSKAVDLWKRMEVVMRIRRKIIAPVLLTIGTAGSLIAGPVLALTTAATPVATTAVAAQPGMFGMHG